MTYKELAALPAEAYLNPENFVTEFDSWIVNVSRKYGEQQYQEGLKIARDSYEVGIAGNGTWYAKGKNGGHTTSYEGIGYHACTADLWRGLLTAKRVVVYRNGKEIRIK